jgi:membrane protein
MQISTRLHQSRSTGLFTWADNPPPSKNPLSWLLYTIIRLCLITFSELRKNDLALRSGALTYTVLLSLVPVLAMSSAVVKGLGGGDQLREVAYSYIDTLDTGFGSIGPKPEPPPFQIVDIPDEQTDSSLTSHLRSALDRLFDYVDKTNFATLGTFGMVGILLSVILVLSNIEVAMNSIWHVKDSRSIPRKIADYLTLIVLLPISINIALVASAFLKNPTLASKFQILIPFIWLQTLILQFVPVFFIALTFYVIYIFFPNTKVKTGPAMLGAFLAALLWFGVQNTYISLQVGVSRYNAIYGSFATLPLFLVWMYLGWLFILGGAQLAYACQNLGTYRLAPTVTPPSQRLSAAFDIMESVQKSFKEKIPVTAQDIIESHPAYNASVLQDVIQELITAEVLHISTTHEQLLPAAPDTKLDHRVLIGIILGTEAPDTPGGAFCLKAMNAASLQSDSLVSDPSGEYPEKRQEDPSST